MRFSSGAARACYLLLLAIASVVSVVAAFGPVLQQHASTQHAGLVSKQHSAVAAGINGDVATTVNGASSPALNIRLSVTEKAKTVVSVCTSGTLCTTSTHEGIEGAPFGSFVDYVLDDDGNPVLLMNEMSMHTINIVNNTNGGASKMVTLFTQLGAAAVATLGGRNEGGGVPQGQDVSRCSITGTIEKLSMNPPPSDLDAIRMRYSIAHSYADQVMNSPKFAFYRISPAKIYYVGGFGVLAKWVPVDEYKIASPDILAKEAALIVARLNRDHEVDLFYTATQLLGCTNVEKIRVTSVDRLGMDIRVTTKVGQRKNKLITDEFRVGFRIPVISVEDAKSEILKVFQEAWEKGNGYSWGEDDEGSEPGCDVPMMKIAADSLG